MKHNACQKKIDQVPERCHSKRNNLTNRYIDSKKTVCDLLERRIEKSPHCLYCQSATIIKNGSSAGLTRYRCKSCGKTFNALTGTPLARLRKKELWLDYLNCLLDSISIRKSASLIQVNSKTAFKWRHRMLNTSHKLEHNIFSGIVEAGETFLRKSMKGSRNLDRAPRKRGDSTPQRTPLTEQVCVLFACDRSGHEADYITGLGPVDSKWLCRFFTPHLSNDVLLITDNTASYRIFCEKSHLAYQPVSSRKRGNAQGIHQIKHVDSYQGQLQTWMVRFHGVATKYLNNYLGWCHELYSMKVTTPVELLKLAFKCRTQLTGT